MMYAVPDLRQTWLTAATIGSFAVALAGFVQTFLTIAKLRYELRKLREDAKRNPPKKTEKRKPNNRSRSERRFEPSDNEIDTASLVRWIVLMIFMGITGLVYTYLSIELRDVSRRRQQAESDLSILSQANGALADVLKLLHERHDRQQKKQPDHP